MEGTSAEAVKLFQAKSWSVGQCDCGFCAQPDAAIGPFRPAAVLDKSAVGDISMIRLLEAQIHSVSLEGGAGMMSIPLGENKGLSVRHEFLVLKLSAPVRGYEFVRADWLDSSSVNLFFCKSLCKVLAMSIVPQNKLANRDSDFKYREKLTVKFNPSGDPRHTLGFAVEEMKKFESNTYKLFTCNCWTFCRTVMLALAEPGTNCVRGTEFHILHIQGVANKTVKVGVKALLKKVRQDFPKVAPTLEHFLKAYADVDTIELPVTAEGTGGSIVI